MSSSGRYSFVVIFVSLVGCGGNTDAVRLNGDVSRLIGEMHPLKQQLDDALVAKDKAKIDAATEDVNRKLAKIADKADKTKVPDDAASKTYWEIFQTIRKNHERILKEDYPKVIRGFLDPAHKDEAAAAFKSIEEAGKRDGERLVEAQKEYAKIKGLKIK